MSSREWVQPFTFDPNSARRYQIEKKFWYVQIVVWTLLFLLWRKVFDLLWELFVVIISIYALAITADGNENSAQAREAARESGDDSSS